MSETYIISKNVSDESDRSSSDGCMQSFRIKRREILFVDKYQNVYGDETVCRRQDFISVKISSEIRSTTI